MPARRNITNDKRLRTEDIPGEDYTPIKVGKGTGGGMMKHPVAGAPSAWLAYVEVGDIGAATKKGASLGATIMKDVTEVMGMGWLSVLIDPTGAALGLWAQDAGVISSHADALDGAEGSPARARGKRSLTIAVQKGCATEPRP